MTLQIWLSFHREENIELWIYIISRILFVSLYKMSLGLRLMSITHGEWANKNYAFWCSLQRALLKISLIKRNCLRILKHSIKGLIKRCVLQRKSSKYTYPVTFKRSLIFKQKFFNFLSMNTKDARNYVTIIK